MSNKAEGDSDPVKIEIEKGYYDRGSKGNGTFHQHMRDDSNLEEPELETYSNEDEENLRHLLEQYGITGNFNEEESLHFAAERNILPIAELILKKYVCINEFNANGWTPLHTACYHASRDVIRLLVQKGADLAKETAHTDNPQTSIDIIYNNFSRPTEFIESIFDTCISTNQNKNVKSGKWVEVVKVDYSILMPKLRPKSLVKNEVIEALLKTGNSRGQRRLLIHPLIQSFVCIQWRILLPISYIMLSLYALFATTLTIFVMSEYYYKDTSATKLYGFETSLWLYALYTTIILVLIQEIFDVCAGVKLYLEQLESWVKLISILLAFILPIVMHVYPSPSVEAIDWPRQVATAAVLLCWLEMAFFWSRFSDWGFYMQMFGNVSLNIVKIMYIFGLLIFGFVLSFMIQSHHEPPFDSFLFALFKTMVMMTSEFEYENLGERMITQNESQSLVMIRLVFVIFMVLVAIALMNLITGVAVDDIQGLKVNGHIMRLEKQMELLASLETLIHNTFFITLFSWLNYNRIILNITLYPEKNIKSKCTLQRIPFEHDTKPVATENEKGIKSWWFTSNINNCLKNAIFEIAVARKSDRDHHNDDQTYLCKIHETVQEFSKKLNILESYKKIVTDSDQMKKQMVELNAKVNKMLQFMNCETQE